MQSTCLFINELIFHVLFVSLNKSSNLFIPALINLYLVTFTFNLHDTDIFLFIRQR